MTFLNTIQYNTHQPSADADFFFLCTTSPYTVVHSVGGPLGIGGPRVSPVLFVKEHKMGEDLFEHFHLVGELCRVDINSLARAELDR